MGGKQRGGKPLYRWRRRGEAGRGTESHRGLRSWFPSQVWDYRHMCVGEGRTPILLCLKTVAPNGLSSTNSRPEDRGSVSSVRFLFSSRIPPPAPHTYPKHKYWISRAHRQLRNLCAKCPGGPAWLGWPSLQGAGCETKRPLASRNVCVTRVLDPSLTDSCKLEEPRRSI